MRMQCGCRLLLGNKNSIYLLFPYGVTGATKDGYTIQDTGLVIWAGLVIIKASPKIIIWYCQSNHWMVLKDREIVWKHWKHDNACACPLQGTTWLKN